MAITLKEAINSSSNKFGKLENGSIFKLRDLSSEERYNLWDKQENKFNNVGESVTATTGETVLVEQTVFKNEDLRELEAINFPTISQMITDLKNYKYETDVMQLEKEMKERLFEIIIKID